MILCEIIQSMIRTVIGSVFLYRFLNFIDYPRAAYYCFMIYLISILTFDLFLSIDIFTAVGIDCLSETDWQVYALISVDSAQSILLVATAIAMHKTLESGRRNSSVLNSSSISYDPSNRVNH